MLALSEISVQPPHYARSTEIPGYGPAEAESCESTSPVISDAESEFTSYSSSASSTLGISRKYRVCTTPYWKRRGYRDDFDSDSSMNQVERTSSEERALNNLNNLLLPQLLPRPEPAVRSDDDQAEDQPEPPDDQPEG